MNSPRSRAAHPSVLCAGLLTIIIPLTLLASVAHADGPPASAGPGYGVPPLTELQLRSIERGAEDLGGATEQSLLSVVLYVSSAATLVAGIATMVVLFTELAPSTLWPLGDSSPSGRPWGAAQSAALGSAIGCLVAHVVTTPLAIMLGNQASRRRDRARRELLLTDIQIGPFGLSVGGRF